MSIAVFGAGAFGTALAIALAQAGRDVTLWARDLGDMAQTRENTRRLPGVALPDALRVTGDLVQAAQADIFLLAVPAQQLAAFLSDNAHLFAGKTVVACCKGIDLTRGIGPVGVIRETLPDAVPAILTGPSFAADIARGLPTALTLACDHDRGGAIQTQLSTPTLRLYLTRDTAGAELGGALKNVIAIACGVCIGAGLGDSARAALMTRGFAEMKRLAPHFGADPETLSGLSGFGDLALTCTSDLSRNYRHGRSLGRGDAPDYAMTVEGAATARAVADLAQRYGIDMPISHAVAALTQGDMDVVTALQTLLARPLREE